MKKLLVTVAAILAIALLTGCPGAPKDNDDSGGNSGSGSVSTFLFLSEYFSFLAVTTGVSAKFTKEKSVEDGPTSIILFGFV